MAVTRLQSRLEVKNDDNDDGSPQMIPVRTNPGKGLALAAGSSEAQEKFLQMMGLTITSINVQKENLFEDSEAETIATALSHVAMLDTEDDPYFTPDQWSAHQSQMEGVLHGLYDVATSTVCLAEDSPLASAYKECTTPRCKCIAHQSTQDLIWKLIDIPDKLTDDWGNKLAHALLPEIFRRGDVNNVEVEGCSQGGLYAVNYILQLLSGEACQFTGWPDFTVSRRYMPLSERRIMMAYHRRARIQGVGEIESPVTTDKTKAFAQAGIYGVGQLANSSHKKMAVIILYKDKSAQVAVASTHLAAIPLQCSVGDVKYQFVSRADSMSLKDPAELQLFARILVSTIKWVSS